jgi:hypothetical protein
MQLETMYNRNTHPDFWWENRGNARLNCGSFALGVDRWYSPYLHDDEADEDEMWEFSYSDRKEWIEELVYEGYSADDIAEYIVDRDFEFILLTCPWLEPIDKEEISVEDRVIAYRISINIPEEPLEFDADDDLDFHFRVLLDGEWWEKNGCGTIHKVEEPESDVWEANEFLIYSGKIRYARFKK